MPGDRVVLTVTAILSLLTATLLLLGYFGSIGLWFGTARHSPSAEYRSYGLQVTMGTIWLDRTVVGSVRPSDGLGWHGFAHLKFSNLKRSFYSYGQSSFWWFGLGPTAWPTRRLIMFDLLFPSWCVWVPCGIAPIIWSRDRRRRNQKGFAVIPRNYA